MPQGILSALSLYSYVEISDKDSDIKIDVQWNANKTKDFSNLCEWFIENKLGIHFGEEKTKRILFGSRQKLTKSGRLLYMKYNVQCTMKLI